MAGERVKLEVQARHACGSAGVRRLRKQGLVPDDRAERAAKHAKPAAS